MEGFSIDARRLVTRLKERSGDKKGNASGTTAPSMQSNRELAYLNRNYSLQTHAPLRDRKGPIRSIRRLIIAFLRRGIVSAMTGYLENEREFFANVVRFQNEVARQIDQLFDEVNRLKDLSRENQFLAERAESLHHLLELRIGELENARESK